MNAARLAEIADEATICDRLRGVYNVPVNDGAGLLNGKDTHTRVFAGVPPIQLAAADLIERLRAELALLRGAAPGASVAREGGDLMPIDKALEVAELCAPAPAIAARALRSLRQALDDQRQRRDLTVLSLFWCLQEIKRALGLSVEHPVAGVPELVAKLRRDAVAAGVV